MAKVTGAHLTGSIKAADAREAMTLAASILGPTLHGVTDGETGERYNWIGFQINRLVGAGAAEFGPPKKNPSEGGYVEMPGLIVRDDAVIEPSALGYSDAAIASYEVFRQLRSEGVIPAGVRFQVSLPTPYAVAIAWGALGSQEAFLRAYKPALFGELATIMAAIPGRDLIIQWDVAVEIGALEGAFVVDGDLGTFARIAAELRDCLEHSAQDSAEPAEIGLHLCYGDYQHRHFAVPSDLGLLVQIANAVGPVDFVHFPVDRQTGLDGAYFTPLRQLSFETIISLGVIDYEQEPGRTDALVAAARSGGSDFLVATECGMGRVGERGEAVSVEQLLADHARVIGTA